MVQMQMSNSVFLPFWIYRWVLWFWISSFDSSLGLQLLSSSPPLRWVCTLFPGVCEWISISLVLSYFLNELCSLIYSQVHGNSSRLEDDQVGLCWGGEGVDALEKLLIKNKLFILFGHLHTSVFDTLKHPQNAAGELWIECCGPITRHLRHLETK